MTPSVLCCYVTMISLTISGHLLEERKRMGNDGQEDPKQSQ